VDAATWNSAESKASLGLPKQASFAVGGKYHETGPGEFDVFDGGASVPAAM